MLRVSSHYWNAASLFSSRHFVTVSPSEQCAAVRLVQMTSCGGQGPWLQKYLQQSTGLLLLEDNLIWLSPKGDRQSDMIILRSLHMCSPLHHLSFPSLYLKSNKRYG